MTEVEIEYCAVCNYLPQALRTSEHILKRHGQELDSGVRIRVGERGKFRIRVDEEVVWDKNVEDLDLGEIEQSVRPKIEPPAA